MESPSSPSPSSPSPSEAESTDGPQSPALIFPSQSVQYIQGAKEASLSLAEWTFSLKVAFTRRTKGSLPGGKERQARRGGHLNTRNSRPDHVNTEEPVTKSNDTMRRAGWQRGRGRQLR